MSDSSPWVISINGAVEASWVYYITVLFHVWRALFWIRLSLGKKATKSPTPNQSKQIKSNRLRIIIPFKSLTRYQAFAFAIGHVSVGRQGEIRMKWFLQSKQRSHRAPNQWYAMLLCDREPHRTCTHAWIGRSVYTEPRTHHHRCSMPSATAIAMAI